jgi:thymidylate synthase
VNAETQYLDHLHNTLSKGVRKTNRTGVDTFVHPYPVMIQHNMNRGFPLLTSKNVAFKPIRVELEGFIKGITDKKWFQDRGCSIWDEWCNPKKVPYSTDPKVQEQMKQENDLGKIYGFQWRNFNSEGYDQLKNIVDTLKTNPDDRRMICSAWNPNDLDEQALPPCHWAFELQHVDGKLNLMWHQRSCDSFLGCPFNIASYALLLHLLCLETGLREGVLTGVFNDFHIYENHVESVREQLKRNPVGSFPTIETKGFTSIFEWENTMTKSVGYNPLPKISASVAI